MKKILNSADKVVREMLEGFVAAHGDRVALLEHNNVIVRRELRPGKVALISGGGSGHEPAHAGFVGRGMLDAAVSGEVFTSPTPDEVLAGVRVLAEAAGGAGVLMIIKNYAGDVMNFEMAAEIAEGEGARVAKVIVNDDVAVEDSTYTTGRRGIAGTVFVHKIAGAAAERGDDLEAVARVAKKVISNVRSKGVGLSPCTVPAVGKPTFELAEDEMEIGLGIHGEPGVRRGKLIPASEIAADLFGSAAADLGLGLGERIAVLVNGLGATPLMEMYVLAREVALLAAGRGLAVHRIYVKEFMTSLEMAGASISLLRLDDELAELLDAPADTPAFVQF
ncbi:MAG: PTS-dependent dihydroxyacetone kinase, dihydroxyacetone-binding subunit DhaK [Firmicutes bacterium ADurb.Bin506]|nr:MAG: PTS-dependent dihydroxyacetone kinase, dihydroxyacetone-binding subunit DhaK [Firmicutes bacterium ADurb.Bin506]